MLLGQLSPAGSPDRPAGRVLSSTGIPCSAGGFGGFQAGFLLLLGSDPCVSLHRRENLFRDRGRRGWAGRCRPAELEP